jgi:hypothetical protein
MSRNRKPEKESFESDLGEEYTKDCDFYDLEIVFLFVF